MKRKLMATIRSKTPLHRGFLTVNRYELDVERHEGGTQRIVREVMERGHSVAVLAYDPELDVVVLINEFRPGCFVAGGDAFTEGLVAGVIGTDETPLAAAIRETHEETGLLLSKPVLVHPGAYVSSGGTSERIAIVAGFVDAGAAGGVHGSSDEAEDILSVVVPAMEFIERARSARITDLKGLVAAYWLADNRASLRAAASEVGG